jgi:putative membrane protein
MSLSDLPTLNATLNLISAVFLFLGYRNIRRGERERHQRFMVAALITSTLFLISYVIYHANIGSKPYPFEDWTRPIYFTILIPHVILAALMAPFIVVVVWRASKGAFEKHRALARFVWPVWMFVSISGVAIYAMLYLR